MPRRRTTRRKKRKDEEADEEGEEEGHNEDDEEKKRWTLGLGTVWSYLKFLSRPVHFEMQGADQPHVWRLFQDCLFISDVNWLCIGKDNRSTQGSDNNQYW